MSRTFASIADRDRIEAEMPWAARDRATTLYDFLSRARAAHGARPALSFQLFSHPRAPAETLTWDGLHARVTQAANLFRDLGVGPGDTVAFVLPNCLEAAVVLLAGATAGVVAPVNPLLEAEQIAAILRENGAKVVVTLRAFPKTDIAQKVARAVRLAPGVTQVLEVDLARYLTGPKRWLVPFLRPRGGKGAMDFHRACAAMPDTLNFEPGTEDRVAACFHTGGTTGMPKLARHRYSGMIYNGWLGGHLLFGETDVLICPLPLFHVFAAYPILMSAIHSGAHVVLPTPAGYRGAGVFDHFWGLIERWHVTFLMAVPTAIAALMQRPVDADISSLRMAISGAAPLPVDLYDRFRAATGVEIAEGYGLTEATCLVAVNPVDGPKKVGSVGLPMPYCTVRIMSPDGSPCATGTVGEICVTSPGTPDTGLRTGDLGRLDTDGYLWITGRARDLIIRSGHNIDPAQIEAALASHPAVASVGAIGQPDRVAGELPCAYVELVAGATVTEAALIAHAAPRIPERAAIPKYLEILPHLPKTAVGKVFKPDLRKRAIARVLDAALTGAGLGAHVAEVVEDPLRGLTARIDAPEAEADALRRVLGDFTVPWDRAGPRANP
ncbi:MAG TPA: acyl-CoA synthetase [Paenirhodobacter sp.]